MKERGKKEEEEEEEERVEAGSVSLSLQMVYLFCFYNLSWLPQGSGYQNVPEAKMVKSPSIPA